MKTFKDFEAFSKVHTEAGVLLLGARKGKYDKDGKSMPM